MADLAGMTLGPYRLMERVGRGGMATVYRAYHAAMDRYVAVKILPEELAVDPSFRARFEREARVVANLQHPHILPVFDYGEDRGISYLVMPYIPTGTLKAYLAQQGQLPLDEAARILDQLARALDYAHRQGILHRDIKPGNVLFDADGNALLTDFGLTRMAQGGSNLTGSGILGTPAYMSPEQGQGLGLDAASDIYSMGIVLYEILTGEVPFSADTPVAVIMKHISDPLPLPTDKRPDLPAVAENVILKALAKDPRDRWVTCSEMSQAFSKAVASATATPHSTERSTTVDLRSEAVSSAVRGITRVLDQEAPSGCRRVWASVAVVIVLIALAGAVLLIQQRQGEAGAMSEGTTPVAQVAITIDTLTPEASNTASDTPAPSQTPSNAPTSTPDLVETGVALTLEAAQAMAAVETQIAGTVAVIEHQATQTRIALLEAITSTPAPPTRTATNTATATVDFQATQAAHTPTILLREDFENASAVAVTTGGNGRSWHVRRDETGNHVYEVDPGAAFDFGRWDWGNYEIVYRFRVLDSADAAFITVAFRMQDNASNQCCNAYIMNIDANIHRLGFLISYETLDWALIDHRDFELHPNTWYDVRIRAYGSTIQIYIDDVLYISANDSRIDKGAISWGVGRDYVQFDDILVTAIDN